jgi:hypothetical protein
MSIFQDDAALVSPQPNITGVGEQLFGLIPLMEDVLGRETGGMIMSPD